jgi:two-component system, NtrC family, sensor kinase
MIFELIIAIIIVRYLRKSLQTQVELPKWDKVLNYIMYAAIILLVADTGFSSLKPVTLWLSHLLLLYLIYILYSQKEFGKARPVLLAIAPFIILSLFSDITKLTNINQYSSWKSLINTAQGFSFVWMIAMWFITNKQRKDLEKEKNKTKAQEEQKSKMMSLKEQLEVQVAQRTAELTKQKEELLHTLEELRSTQAQLIQSEKMASLGELTAGIAHEIQNPLNFVNNFSELNKELLGELKEEIDNGNLTEVKNIATNVIDNEEKINTHGRRADAIVKGMLQHSRLSTGQKEPTDINALADEYLRLAFHGLRAKEKSFNATMKTEFDQTIPKLNIVPQDIGRVILNLITNAFYVVNEKKLSAGPEYEPIVTIITRKGKDRARIAVKDNGNGIPEKVMDKIFQPFFTTKPAGQGTGLGLSLSYDIIKAHGGELKVQTKEGIGSEFVIELPYV